MKLLFSILLSTVLLSFVWSWHPDKKQRFKALYEGRENYTLMKNQYKAYGKKPNNYIPSPVDLYKIAELKQFDMSNATIVKKVVLCKRGVLLSVDREDNISVPAYIQYTVTPNTSGSSKTNFTFYVIITERMDQNGDFKIKRIFPNGKNKFSFSWVSKKNCMLDAYGSQNNTYENVAKLFEEFQRDQKKEMHATCNRLIKHYKTKTEAKFMRFNEAILHNTACYLAIDDNTFVKIPGYLWCSFVKTDERPVWKYYAYDLNCTDWVEINYDHTHEPTHDGLPLLSVEKYAGLREDLRSLYVPTYNIRSG